MGVQTSSYHNHIYLTWYLFFCFAKSGSAVFLWFVVWRRRLTLFIITTGYIEVKSEKGSNNATKIYKDLQRLANF